MKNAIKRAGSARVLIKTIGIAGGSSGESDQRVYWSVSNFAGYIRNLRIDKREKYDGIFQHRLGPQPHLLKTTGENKYYQIFH
ncbi:MAG: hypothetical protein EZS28_030540 [Streblomastix strix]|uniref:Uncharacterized protein n=1 Tax=Streblomastix strix TaxID=222440 RepID=A0A5J4UV38_9EUKA|nr:MAG: hypothetical protein EZS28_030540 [Streblomastix strix]